MLYDVLDERVLLQSFWDRIILHLLLQVRDISFRCALVDVQGLLDQQLHVLFVHRFDVLVVLVLEPRGYLFPLVLSVSLPRPAGLLRLVWPLHLLLQLAYDVAHTLLIIEKLVVLPALPCQAKAEATVMHEGLVLLRDLQLEIPDQLLLLVKVGLQALVLLFDLLAPIHHLVQVFSLLLQLLHKVRVLSSI